MFVINYFDWILRNRFELFNLDFLEPPSFFVGPKSTRESKSSVVVWPASVSFDVISESGPAENGRTAEFRLHTFAASRTGDADQVIYETTVHLSGINKFLLLINNSYFFKISLDWFISHNKEFQMHLLTESRRCSLFVYFKRAKLTNICNLYNKQINTRIFIMNIRNAVSTLNSLYCTVCKFQLVQIC